MDIRHRLGLLTLENDNEAAGLVRITADQARRTAQRLAGQTMPLPAHAMRDTEFATAFLKAQGLKGLRLEQTVARMTAIGRGEKLPADKGAGLTAKGRAKFNRETGSNLKAPQPQGGARRDSFCARMGPVAEKSEKGSRARASMQRWNCPGW